MALVHHWHLKLTTLVTTAQVVLGSVVVVCNVIHVHAMLLLLLQLLDELSLLGHSA